MVFIHVCSVLVGGGGSLEGVLSGFDLFYCHYMLNLSSILQHAVLCNIPTTDPHIYSHRFYPLLPYWSFHCSNAHSPSLLTLGLTFLILVTKSSNPIALISSLFVVNNASPNDLNGPIAASLVNAVISDPENPTIRLILSLGGGDLLSIQLVHRVDIL